LPTTPQSVPRGTIPCDATCTGAKIHLQRNDHAPRRGCVLSEAQYAAVPVVAGGRLAVLDGIRGWTSLVVLLFHLLPWINATLLPELDTSAVAMIFDGPLAVWVFFILSGEALSAGYLRTGNLGIVRTLAARRYFRLTLPILFASALVWFAMVSGLDAHRAAASVLQFDSLAGFLDFRPSLGGLLRYALRDVYFDPPPPLHYVPLLWTMRVELLGSCVVFGVLALSHGWGVRQRLIADAVALLLLAAFVPSLAGFVVGMLLGEARRHGWLEALRRSRWCWPALLTALLLLLGISAARAAAHHHLAIRYILRAYLGHSQYAVNPLLMYANAFGLFLLVALLPPLERFLGGRVSRFLGEISFPLYLVQFAVLITLTSWLIVWFVDPGHPTRIALYAIAVVSVGASLLLAYGFARVERRALRVANTAVARLFA
jgi:peptidoglycan/LPS O-acetylase OafA/YrhL